MMVVLDDEVDGMMSPQSSSARNRAFMCVVQDSDGIVTPTRLRSPSHLSRLCVERVDAIGPFPSVEAT